MFVSLMPGHAFEARIYAENVPKGFLPATGVLHRYCPVTVTSAGADPYYDHLIYEMLHQASFKWVATEET